MEGDVILLYIRPIFQPPHHIYSQSLTLGFLCFTVGTSLLFVFLLVSTVPQFITLNMSEKVPGCSVVILRSKRAGFFKFKLVKLIFLNPGLIFFKLKLRKDN